MRKTIIAILSLVATAALAQTNVVVSNDKDVRTGRLANGLTYYIRHNEWPEHRADFYIAQRVGSIQENDDQRGLAHFLEHMCFNGSKHFKGNDIIRYCESLGVQFGGDLNAYTGVDRTVYNISNVPTTRQSALDSCLLILYDWADGLALTPDEIDKERGVINEEWRFRSSAVLRMEERCLPRLFPGSKYGERMPIGLMSIVNSFKPQTLQDYYEKWYRPDNQAIIVVGDVDVDRTEKEIHQLFGNIATPENAAQVVDEPVPDTPQPIVVVDKDKEMSYDVVKLMFKHNVFTDSLKNTVRYMAEQYAVNACVSMLSDRLDETAKTSSSPFLSAGAYYGGYDDFVEAKTKDAFGVRAVPKDSMCELSLAALVREARRAAEYGFTATEYARYKTNLVSQLDKVYSNRDKRYNSQFCYAYVENFLSNEPYPSIDDEYQIMKQLATATPLETVNATMAGLMLSSDSNMVIVNYNTEKAERYYPTESSLLKAVNDTRHETLTAYVDKVKDEPLISAMPKAGRIVKETRNERLGYTELTLSNGATVVLKPTDYKKDQVLLSAEGFGGGALYGADDFANIKLFDNVVEASGLGSFSHTELEKALTGKVAAASLALGNNRQYVNASSTPRDVETMMQLVYLYFTDIKKDQESYDNLMQQAEVTLRNRSLSPESAINDTVAMVTNCHNPRFAPITYDDLQKVNYDRILQIAKERTANAAAYTFNIIGNFSTDSIRPLIERYIASLPSQKAIERGPRVDTDAKGYVVSNFHRKMETPKAFAIIIWKSDSIPYTLENKVRAAMAGQVLTMIYLSKIREDAGAAYHVQASGTMTKQDDKTDCGVFALCPLKPEKVDFVVETLRSEIDSLATTCDETLLAKVKEYMLKSHADGVKTNGYWDSVIDDWRNNGVDNYTDYETTVNAQTPAEISSFVKLLLKAGNCVEVVMLPE